MTTHIGTLLLTDARTLSAVCWSRPEITSSRTRRCGRLRRALAMRTRCLCPSESSLAFLSSGKSTAASRAASSTSSLP